MGNDFAFDVPIDVRISNRPVRTVGEAVVIVRSHLQAQFTMDRLTTLLALERATEGSEIAEARTAFAPGHVSTQALGIRSLVGYLCPGVAAQAFGDKQCTERVAGAACSRTRGPDTDTTSNVPAATSGAGVNGGRP